MEFAFFALALASSINFLSDMHLSIGTLMVTKGYCVVVSFPPLSFLPSYKPTGPNNPLPTHLALRSREFQVI